MIEPSDILVVILSRESLTGLSIARSLGMAGYTVDIVSSVPCEGLTSVLGACKYVRNLTEVVRRRARKLEGDSFGKDDELLATLVHYVTDSHKKCFLFPVGDDSVFFMERNRATLSAVFDMPYVADGAPVDLIGAMDKEFQCNLAREAGLSVPNTRRISLKGGKPVIPDDVEYPVFCKPASSIAGWKIEMSRCDDRARLDSHLRWLAKAFSARDMLVQDYLNIDYEICLSGVCFDEEVIIPGVVHKTAIGTHLKGATIAGYLEPTEVLGETLQTIVDFLKRFHYFGMFDMELLYVDDEAFFGELNLRSGGPNFAYLVGGANLPDACVRGIMGLGRGETKLREDAYQRTFVVENVAWDEYLSNHLSKSKLTRIIEGADERLFYREDDEAPGRLYSEHVKKVTLEKKVKRGVKKGLLGAHLMKP